MPDSYLDFHDKPKRKFSFTFILVIISVITGHLLIFSYYKGYLPHYTIQVDGNTLTFVRDDPKYLAEQAALEAEANRQIYRINGQEVTQQEYEQALQQQQQQAENQPQTNNAVIQVEPFPEPVKAKPMIADGQVRKCLDAQNHPVYQTQPCETNGYKTAKVLTQNDGNVSQSQTYNYKQAEQRKEANQTYTVDGRQVSKAEYDAVIERNKRVEAQNASNKAEYCKSLQSRREYIQSQQRVNSTQYWRDQYTEASKEWQTKCLSSSQGWS